jgi:hypothetical protein
MEQVLMDKMLTWLDYQAGSSQPFFLYYAPNAIHRSVAGWRMQRSMVLSSSIASSCDHCFLFASSCRS